MFLSRTSDPYFLKGEGLYLAFISGDNAIYLRTSEVLASLVLRGGTKAELEDMVHIIKTYKGPWPVAKLLAKTGILDEVEARNSLSTTFRNYNSYMTYRPDSRTGLGLDFHSMKEAEIVRHMLVLGAYGCFHGQLGWRRWNRVFMEGAWPLLCGYRKAYAKVIYTLTVSLFAALELDYVNSGVTDLMVTLIKMLVGSTYSGGPWKLRSTHRLKD